MHTSSFYSVGVPVVQVSQPNQQVMQSVGQVNVMAGINNTQGAGGGPPAPSSAAHKCQRRDREIAQSGGQVVQVNGKAFLFFSRQSLYI